MGHTMFETHRQGRNEFQVFSIAICIFIGATQVIFDQTPESLKELPPAYQVLWSWFLLLGGLLAMAGIFIRDEATGLFVELSGLLLLAFSTLAFGLAVLTTSEQLSSLVSTPLTLSFSAACFRRCYKILHKLSPRGRQERLLDEVRKQVEEHIDTEQINVTPTLDLSNSDGGKRRRKRRGTRG